jgi:hypothetical protein
MLAVIAVITVVLGVGLALAIGVTSRPQSPTVESVAAALREAYPLAEGASRTAVGPQVNYRRLKAAVFLAHRRCGGNGELLLAAACRLENEGFFAGLGYADAADDIGLLEQDLAEIERWRLAWLERTVLPALAQSRPAEVRLPREVIIDFGRAESELTEKFSQPAEVEGQIADLRQALDKGRAGTGHE